MRSVNIYDAKTRFSELVDRAAGGEDVIISRNGRPVARITRLPEKKQIKYGLLKGRLWIAEDFDAPLPPEIQTAFEG